jgi:PAS domain-containing protein
LPRRSSKSPAVSPIRNPDGGTAYFVTTRCPVLDADGHLTAILGIARDVTAEQKAHFELAASEKRFHTLFDSATDMIMVADQDARFIDINRNTCETLGYSREELLAMRVTDIQTDASLDELKQMWQSTEIQHGISLHHTPYPEGWQQFSGRCTR